MKNMITLFSLISLSTLASEFSVGDYALKTSIVPGINEVRKVEIVEMTTDGLEVRVKGGRRFFSVRKLDEYRPVEYLTYDPFLEDEFEIRVGQKVIVGNMAEFGTRFYLETVKDITEEGLVRTSGSDLYRNVNKLRPYESVDTHVYDSLFSESVVLEKGQVLLKRYLGTVYSTKSKVKIKDITSTGHILFENKHWYVEPSSLSLYESVDEYTRTSLFGEDETFRVGDRVFLNRSQFGGLHGKDGVIKEITSDGFVRTNLQGPNDFIDIRKLMKF